MKSYVRSFILIFGFCLVFMAPLPNDTLKACGPYPITNLEPAFWGTDYLSFFEFDLSRDPLYPIYCYNSISRSLGLSYPEYGEEKMSWENYRNNIEEWRTYLGISIKPELVYQLIYKVPSDELRNLNAILLKGSKKKRAKARADYYRKNPIYGLIIDQNRTDILDYLIFAKDCEPLVTADPWEEPHKIYADESIAEGLKAYELCRSEFLKMRYAYQVIRLSNYSGLYEDCCSQYDRLIAPLRVNSIIRYWALRQKAGAMLHLERKVDYLVLTSLIFDQCPDQMLNALRDFFIPDERTWTAALKAAGDKHRQATLWLMRGLKEKHLEMDSLRQMYALEPSSPRLEAMLVRQVNRIECLYLDSTLFFPPKSTGSKQDAVQSLQTFALEGGQSGKIRQPALWFLVAGYMSFLGGDQTKAGELLKQAAAAGTNNPNLRQQIQLIGHLMPLAQNKPLAPEQEQAFQTSLSWLSSLQGDAHNKTVPRSLLILLAQKNLAAGRLDRALCYLAKAKYEFSVKLLLDVYAKRQDMERLESLVSHADPGSFKSWLIRGFPYSLDDLHYINGTKMLRKGDFHRALVEYKQVSKVFWENYRSRLKKSDEWTQYFNHSIYLYTSFYPPSGKKSLKYFDKLTFTTKLVELVDLAKSDPKHADQYYARIGNGFANCSIWGYNDILWRGNLVESLSQFSPKEYPFNFSGFSEKLSLSYQNFLREYATSRMAVRFYDRAVHTANDRGKKAEYLYYLLETKKTDNWFIDQYPTNYDKHIDDFSQYDGTAYRKRFLLECY